MPVDLSGSLRGTLSVPIDVTVHDETIQAIEDGINANETAAAANAAALAALGTASAEDVGTSAGNVVQLDGSARLPAVDGSQLTGIAGGGHMIEDEGTPLTQRVGLDPAEIAILKEQIADLRQHRRHNGQGTDWISPDRRTYEP